MSSSLVFVDDSGRRRGVVRVVGWCLGLVVVAYLSLLVASVAGPRLAPLRVPAHAAPHSAGNPSGSVTP